MTTVNFTGLAAGTKLDDQLVGLKFLKYGPIGGLVIDTGWGRVASFEDNESGCEFCGSGARIAFSVLQRSVSLHVGLQPTHGVVVQWELRLTGFNAVGVPVGTATTTVIDVAGFGTPLAITIATPQIATVVLEAVNDPAIIASIAISDISFEEITGAGADFFLEGALSESVVQGNAPVDIPLTIFRIGGSSGDIAFALSSLPAGVTGTFIPNPASGTSVALRLQADTSSVPETKQVIVTAMPLIATAGPAARTHPIVLTTVPKLSMGAFKQTTENSRRIFT